MTTLRYAACVLFAAASIFVSPAFATSFSTDQSDLWYIPAESGWGMQLVQRGSVIFATLFVYGPSGAPTWYTATLDYTTNFVWTGDLYATTGDYFTLVPFNPSDVKLTNVGTMTWQSQTVNTGMLTYVVGANTVVKNMVRQTLVLDDYSGHYGGGVHTAISGCTNPALNGTVENIGVVNITQDGSAITMQSLPTAGVGCTYVGTLTEFGQMGEIDAGSFTCTDGSAGAFQSFEMQVNETGFTGHFTATDSNPPGCQQEGWFGGLVVTTY